MMRLRLLLIIATTVFGGCAMRAQMPEDCGPVPLDQSFTVATGELRQRLLGELADANVAAAIDNFDLKTNKQFVAHSGDRAFVCQLSSCSAAWWSFERVDGKWVNRSQTPAVCVVR